MPNDDLDSDDKTLLKDNNQTPTPTTGSPTKGRGVDLMAKAFARAASELVENEDYAEKFDESTYNKKLERLKSSLGDQAMNADSVVLTIRKATRTVREATEFLSKLYNAPATNLWYRPDEQEEIYTTITPDYR